MINSDRLKALMAERGLSQSELARRVNISQTAVGKLAMGTASGSRFLHAIARELGTTAAYLTNATDDPLEGALPAPTPASIAEHLDLVPIASVDAQYGLGSTFLEDHIEAEVMQFPRAWVEGFTHTPSTQLTFARGRGDSMYPTIGSGDMVLIDRSQRVITEPDLIWAYVNGQFGGIKRLRVRGNRVTILSDNPVVPPDEVLADDINIIGRVIMIMRSI